MDTTKKSATRRHEERGEDKVDPREAIMEVVRRSGKKVAVGEMRTAEVKWMVKTGRREDRDQVYGYELEEGEGEPESRFRRFPGRSEPVRVYPMLTLRYTPKPGTVHRCLLVTLPFSLTDRKSGEKIGEELRTYAHPVDRRPLYRTGEWNDNPISVVTVRGFRESNRQGVCYYAFGPNNKKVVVRDKSFVPPEDECKVVVTEEVSSFTALCLDVDLKQAAPDGSEMKSGDLALAGDALQTRLTDDPWYYVYDRRMYAITAVLGGEMSPNSTVEDLKGRFAALSKTDNTAAQARKFKKNFGIAPSQKDKDAFAREWGLIVACYKQMEMNLLRRDMQSKHGPTGTDKFRFGMAHVPLQTIAVALKLQVADVRRLLAEIGLPIPSSVTQVAKPFAETVCGYYTTEKDPSAAPAEPMVINRPLIAGVKANGPKSPMYIQVDLDVMVTAWREKSGIKINGRTADEIIRDLVARAKDGQVLTINGEDAKSALAGVGIDVDGFTARALNGKPGIRAQRLATPPAVVAAK